MTASVAPLLSVIVPFYNAFHKAQKVLLRIQECIARTNQVEFVLIDDGSTDDTLFRLQEFHRSVGESSQIKLISQQNKGPGAARNVGVSHAVGKYIWFVDADDDCDVALVIEDMSHITENIDFIDYNYHQDGHILNSMSILEGYYAQNDVDLYLCLGRIWTKIFRKSFWINNKLRYPEYCIYEDNYLIYTMPVSINVFFKSNKVAYYYSTDTDSITRSKVLSPRFFDRLITSYEGMQFLSNNGLVTNSVSERFRSIFLYTTVRVLLSYSWIKYTNEICWIISTFNYLNEKYLILPKNKTLKNTVIMMICKLFGKKNHMDIFYRMNEKNWQRHEG